MGRFVVYAVPVNELRQAILRALGDGGTMEMADGVLAFLSVNEVDLIAPVDPFADDDATEDAEPLELAGLAEVSEITGRPKQLIGHWLAGRRSMPENFPRPRWHISAGPVWDKSEVQTWRMLEVEELDPHGDEPTPA